MIILMISSYNTIHVGKRGYYNVSEVTWQCYCKFVRWAQDEYHTASLMFQGGWGIKIDG